MQKTIYTCDHCGAECGHDEYATLWGELRSKGATYVNQSIHACNREHAVLALAKILALPLDVDLAEKLARETAEVKRLQGVVRSQNAEIARLHAECERLDKEATYQRKLYEEALDNRSACAPVGFHGGID